VLRAWGKAKGEGEGKGKGEGEGEGKGKGKARWGEVKVMVGGGATCPPRTYRTACYYPVYMHGAHA
jgi:hypothetical protein